VYDVEADPLSRAGLISLLNSRPGITVVQIGNGAVDVLVLSARRFGVDVIAQLRRLASEVAAPTVLIANEITGAEALTAVECRVMAILPRASVTGERLARSVTAATTGNPVMPTKVIGEFLKQVEHLQRAMTSSRTSQARLSQREIDVLRLAAEGLDTNDIASQLDYSPRTVKNIVYVMTQRLGLRNRPHAVAYAIRAGIL
jgi:DNA-binding NarL/FixJ family response regulator